MPGKNSLKIYVENGFYHIYNRGVEKRNIFIDEQDYRVFLSYLKLYLIPKEESVNNIENNANLTLEEKNEKISRILVLNNFFNKINLFCYALMPNHFHFELRQTNKKDIEVFMRSLITKYTVYFNKKYDRVGPLFQGRYKAVLIKSEEYLLHLSRYIHLNPLDILNKDQSLVSYPWTSYSTYVNNFFVDWLDKDFILSYFKRNQSFSFDSYQKFVESYKERSEEEERAYKSLLLDLGRSLKGQSL